MKHQEASWNLVIAKSVNVQVSVKGCTELSQASPDDVMHASMILREVGLALKRIADRWAQVEGTELRRRVG